MNAPTINIADLHDAATGGQEGAPTTSTGVVTEGPPNDTPSPSLFDNMLFPMVACFLVFWFIVIRPEKRQRKAREEMLSRLSKGDEIITSGGIHGKVSQVKDEVVTVQVAEGVRMRIAIAAVQTKVNTDEPSKDGDDQD